MTYPFTFGDFVTDVYGAETWSVFSRKVELTKAQLTATIDLDPTTFAQLQALLCKEEGYDYHDAGVKFGAYLFQQIMDFGYFDLIARSGRNLVEFLKDFDRIYLHMTTIGCLKWQTGPEFYVDKVTPTSLEFHYFSNRAGLGPWIEGMCLHVAEVVFRVPCTFRLIAGRADGTSDHEIFEVLSDNTNYLGFLQQRKTRLARKHYSPEPSLFYDLFPCHFVMDHSFVVVQSGGVLHTHVPGLEIGASIPELFEITHPSTCGWDIARLTGKERMTFLLKARGGMEVIGSFHATHSAQGRDLVLFAGSPRISNLAELESHGMFLTDIAPHDMSADWVVMAEAKAQESKHKHKLELHNKDLQSKAHSMRKDIAEAEEAMTKLKESLAEALSTRDRALGNEVRNFQVDTPAEKTIKILEAFMHGEEVNLAEVVDLRDAIISSGNDIMAPMHIVEKVKDMDYDNEINQSLLTMLNLKAHQEDDDDNDSVDSGPSEHSCKSSMSILSMSALSSCTTSVESGSSIVAGSGLKRRASKHRMSILQSINLSDTALTILSGPSDPVMAVLAKVDDWQFDTFELNAVTKGQPLSTLAFYLMKRLNLVPGKNQISEVRLARFLCATEEGYPDNPYHNRIHAADVLRTTYVMMTRGGIGAALGPENMDQFLLVSLVTAAVHDYEHKGVNNDYLIKSSSKLAVLYNDKSPMENHHLAAAFGLMGQDSYDFMHQASAKTKAQFRKMVIEMVMGTDMKQHFTLVSQFKTRFLNVPSGTCRTPASEAAHSDAPSSAVVFDEDTSILTLQMMVKAADVGHLTTTTPVHIKWVERLEEELFLQGDQERANHLPISPLMDRSKGGITRSQVGFFSIIAMPLFQAVVSVFPDCAPLLDGLKENHAMWASRDKA